jgi:hypothetical protein
MFHKKSIIWGLIFFTITAFNIWVVEAQEYVIDGLIGFWTMDEKDIQGDTVKDISGENNHGKTGGDPEIVEGKIDEALHFDGEDDFVAIPDLGNEPAVSVDLWAIIEKPFPDIRGLLSTYDPPQWKAGSVHFKFENNNIDILKNGGGRIQIPAEPNRWYHVGYTCDTDKNELKLYVDGKLINTVAAGAEPNNLTHLRIGSEHEGRYFPGILDEARLYNRALTEKEMKQNFSVKNNEMAVNVVDKLTITWGKLKNLRD